MINSFHLSQAKYTIRVQSQTKKLQGLLLSLCPKALQSYCMAMLSHRPFTPPNQNLQMPLQLIPLQPQNYFQIPPYSGFQVGNITYQPQQNPPYLYKTPPMIYHPSNFSFFNSQPPPPPPPPEFTCVPSPTPLSAHRVKENKAKEQNKQEPKYPNHGKLSRTHMLPMPVRSKPKIGKNPSGRIGVSRMGERIENRLRKPTSFVCKMKFWNELPDLTAQPKILPLKRNPDRYTSYNASAVERMWKPELYPKPDLGIPLDLLDLSVYNPPMGERLPLDPEDEELLRDDDDPITETPSKQIGLRRKEWPDDQRVPLLIKTQYISPLHKKSTKKPQAKREGNEMHQRLGGRNILQKLNDREGVIKEIEACKSVPTHVTNKNLHHVEVIPLLPDFDQYNDQFVVATFDSDPTADSEVYKNLNKYVRDACESKAIMKSCVAKESDSDETDRFLAYLAPLLDEMSKDINAEEKDVSYSWVQSDDADDPKSYLVSFDNSEARYVPLPTKLKLRKKKMRKKIPTKMVVRRPSIAENCRYQTDSRGIVHAVDTFGVNCNHMYIDGSICI